MSTSPAPTDTPPVPRDAATVVLLRDQAEGMQVLLVRRHQNSRDMGGLHVFPGGKLDEADAESAQALQAHWPTLHQHLGEPELSPQQAAALHVAAAREALEECGVALDPRALHPWSRWITPKVPLMMVRRFDTRFFVARLPEGAVAQHDAHETTEILWINPRVALERYGRHEMTLAAPQLVSLLHLAQHPNTASVLAEAQAKAPPLIEPHRLEEDGYTITAYPGDPTHPVRERVLPLAMTRVYFRDDRFMLAPGQDHWL